MYTHFQLLEIITFEKIRLYLILTKIILILKVLAFCKNCFDFMSPLYDSNVLI